VQQTWTYNSILISNDAKIWPATLMGYASKVEDECHSKLKAYIFLGVGQNTTIPPSKHVCVMYSPIGLMWSVPQLYEPNKSIVLQSKIINGQLEYQFIVH